MREGIEIFSFDRFSQLKNTCANKGKSLINLIDPRLFPFYLEILESRMRPCGVVNTVGGTRITDRHLLPVDGPRPWPGCQAPGKISIVSFCVTQVSPLFLFFFFSFLGRRRNSEEQRGKKRTNVVYCRGAFKFDEPFLFLIFLRD